MPAKRKSSSPGWSSSASSKTTTDHEQIRKWAEERNGRPAVVRTRKEQGGILRIDFGEPEEAFEPGGMG